jgi:hypothetical protein
MRPRSRRIFWSSCGQYWLSLSPFCLPGGDAGRVDVLLAAHDDAVDFAGDVSLQGADWSLTSNSH